MPGWPPSPPDLTVSQVQQEPRSGAPAGNWQAIFRWKYVIAAAAVAGALAGYVVARRQQPVYRARTSLELQTVNRSYLSIRDIDPHAGDYPDDAYVPTQLRILQSETLLERTNAKLAKAPGGPTGEARARALALASSTLRVRSANGTRFVEIYTDSTDPKIAADFANTLAAEFSQDSIETRWNGTERTRELLKGQLLDLKVKLQNSERQLQDYMQKSGLMFVGEKNSIAERKLEQVQQQLAEAHSDLTLKQSRYEMAAASAAENGNPGADGAATEYRSKLTDLRRQLAEASVLLAPGHYKVQRLQAEIREVEAAIKGERAEYLENLRTDYEASRKRESLLADAFGRQSALVSDLSVKAIHYNILREEVNTGRQLYDAMLQKLKEATIASAVRPNTARIVDYAKPPQYPYRPDFRQNVSLGMFAGLMLSCLWACIRERTDRNLRHPGEARSLLNVAELGVIPRADKSPYRSNPAPLMDFFRATLASILLSRQDSNLPAVLVITSPGAGEGKTMMVAKLGAALAEMSRSVLLIDADFRRPKLHDRLGMRQSEGLSELLLSDVPLTDAAIERVVQNTPTSGVFLLPLGAGAPEIAGALYSDRMKQLIAMCRSRYGMLLIDTPPVLQVPEGRMLARLADGVVLVFRANQTTRQAALAARQRLQEDLTPILGVVLNDWNPKDAQYGYPGANYYQR